MSTQVSEWIGVEQNKWVFLFPRFGLSSFWKCPRSHTSTQSQSLADQYLTLSLGTGPGCSACWATDILPKAVLSSMAHNLTGTKSSSGQAVLCRTVVPLVADSSAVTAVMMAFCQGCGRKAGRCWGRGHWQVESTWLLPSISGSGPPLNLMMLKDIGEDSMRTEAPLWPWSSHVISLCFSFSPAKLWSATVLWSRTQQHIDGSRLLLTQIFSAPSCLLRRGLFREENGQGVHDTLGTHTKRYCCK